MTKGRKMSKKRRSIWKILLVVLMEILCLGIIIAVGFKTSNPTENSGSSEAIQTNQEVPETEEGTMISEEKGPSEIVVMNKREASYEEWLAAGMVVSVSMEYPEFELMGIYLTGETKLADKQTSNGAYVVFEAEGAQRAVYSFPLDAERTEAGTTDLYTKDLGFSAFEQVDPETIDTAACKQVTMEDLDELIKQSILVSMYEH